jgi:pimeloyl-ACP methyl ester carboxylesterase
VIPTERDFPPIVLAHGWGGSPGTHWPESGLRERARASGRTVIAPRLPGHSPEPSPTYPAAYRELARIFATSLPVDPFDAVGYSLGGKLLLEIAAHEPDRVRRLVVIGVGGNLFLGEDGNPIADALMGSISPKATPALTQVVDMALSSGNQPSAMAAVIRRPGSPMTRAELSAISAAVLIIAGDRDRIGHSPEELAGAVPNARLVVIPELDHGALLQSPQVSDLALTFLTAP